MKMFITGGTGFIGRHLAVRLSELGHDVTCLVRSRQRALFLESLNVRLCEGNLDSRLLLGEAIAGSDMVFHLAGVTRARSTKEYYEGNHLATKKLVAICREHSDTLRRFVHVSSLAAVGPARPGSPLTEEASYHPVSHYGKSKMLGEIEVRRAEDRLATTIVRPVAVFGPADEGFLEYFRLIKKGFLPMVGWGIRLLSMVYVNDLVEGIIQASENCNARGQTYFLGDDEPYSIDEIGTTIASVMQLNARRIHLPEPLVLAYGAVSEAAGKFSHNPVLFNTQKAKEGIQRAWICSVDKARKELGFFASTSLFEGMSRSYEWYCRNGWL